MTAEAKDALTRIAVALFLLLLGEGVIRTVLQ